MSRLLKLTRRLGGDRRGAATIEFAMWSAFFFMGMLTALDFALWRTQQLRLGSAIEQGGMLAFKSRTNLDQVFAGTIDTYVTTAASVAGSAEPNVTVQCNDGTEPCKVANRKYVCLSTAANGAISFSNPLPKGNPCSSPADTTAGYYFKIHVARPYQSAILPNDLLSGKMMSDSVLVRLE